MGVDVYGRDYENRYRAEVVDWLLGNVGDWQKLTLTTRFAVEIKFTTQSILMVEGTSDMVITNGAGWSSYGFDVGDEINFEFRYRFYDTDGNLDVETMFTHTRNVTAINGVTMTVDGASLADGTFNTFPYNSNQVKADQVIVWADKRPEGAILTYGHIENADADSFNLSSFIDGTKTRIAALNMHTMGTSLVPMDFMGNQSGMSIKSAMVAYIAKIGTHSYDFTFELEFMLSSFFEDLTNFETQTAPSQVFDASSLTDNFEIIGFPEWNNPNLQIKNVMANTKRLGNTGWFNENFNGLDNNFTLKSVEYTDVLTSQPLQRLSYGSEVRVKAVIGGVGSLADGLTKNSLGFIWLPEEESYYKVHETPFHENLKVNTAGGFGSGVFVNSPTAGVTTYNGFSIDSDTRMDVKDVHFYEDSGDLVYEATWKPTPEFTAFVDALDEADRNYALWISVADRTIVTNFSDRVNILLDYNYMEIFIAPVGAWSPMAIDFYNHPQSGVGAKIGCGGNIFVEDDILTRADFNVDIADVIPNAIQFTIEAVNTTTLERFELQKFKVDLSIFPIDGAGVPQWNYNDIRGFKLEVGNNKNWVKVQRNASTDLGTSYGYTAYFAYKVRWEDWILRTGVPADFFDNTLLNNGFNNDWFHYFETVGWEVRFAIYLDAIKDGVSVRYLNEKQIIIKDYESNALIDEEWKFIRESDSTTLVGGTDPISGKPLGVILDNEFIIIEVKYTKLTGSWASISEVYGTICFEVDKGGGQFDFRQLSSYWGREADCPLVPLVGETKLKMTLATSTTIIMSCRLDPSLIQDSTRYKFSSRIDSKNL